MLGKKKYSVGVFRSAVLRSGFPVMTRFTKCLPVVITPHKVIITTVWNYVVNHRCRNVSSLCHTLHTQRVLTEISLAYSLPLAAVATLGG